MVSGEPRPSHMAERKWCPYSFIPGPVERSQDYIACTVINNQSDHIQLNSLGTMQT